MAEKTIHLKRTSLYASGASPVNMIQAVFYNEDVLIYDLEDSVPAAEKDAARFLVYNMVKNHRPKDKYVAIRVNGIYSEYLEEDLQAAVRANPDCIRIPKVEYAREVQDISTGIGQHRAAASRQNRSQKNNRRSHLPHHGIGDLTAGHGTGMYAQRVPLPLRTAAQTAQNTDRGIHILQVRAAVEHALSPVEQCRCQNRQHAVFCSLNLQFPL